MAIATKAEVEDFEEPGERGQHGRESVGRGQRAREVGVSKLPFPGLYSGMLLLTVFTKPLVPGRQNPGSGGGGIREGGGPVSV